MLKVSVIIPTYNRPQYLLLAIESVLKQTFQDFEIIVTGDGAPDSTRVMVEKYKDKVRFVNQEHMVISAARNNGIRYATGEWIAFLDDDDIWLPEKLKRQIDAIERHPEIAMVGSEVFTIDAEGRRTGHWKKSDLGLGNRDTFNDLFEGNYLHAMTTMIRKDCLLAAGCFDEELKTTEDYDLWLRIAKKHKFHYINEPLAEYRLHGKRASDDSSRFDARIRNTIKVLNRKELSADMSLLRKVIRAAKVYYLYAGIYIKYDNPLKGGINYFMAVLTYPFIGIYYWPKEVRNIPFSMLYRILKIYFMAAGYFFRGLLQNLKIILTA